ADRGEAVTDDHPYAGFEDARLDKGLLLTRLGPGRDGASRRDQRHHEAAAPQLFRHHAAHVSVIVVEDHPRTANRGTRDHSLGREDIGAIAAGDGPRMGAADAVLAPTRTRGEHDMGGAELLHIGGGQAAVAIDADVRHALDLADAMVAHPDPLVETG